MEFIKIQNSDKIVRIKITIECAGPYEYIYTISTGNSINYSSTEKPPKPFPHNYVIGVGSSLVLINNHWNNWDFKLINPADQDLDYIVYIEWYQDDNDNNPIYTWPQDEKLRKGIIKSSDNHIELSESCIYKPI